MWRVLAVWINEMALAKCAGASQHLHYGFLRRNQLNHESLRFVIGSLRARAYINYYRLLHTRLGLCVIGPFDENTLISRQSRWQRSNGKPAGTFDFDRSRFQIYMRVGSTTKKNLDLSGFPERARAEEFDAVNFESNFFAQFSSQRFFWLFAGFQ